MDANGKAGEMSQEMMEKGLDLSKKALSTIFRTNITTISSIRSVIEKFLGNLFFARKSLCPLVDPEEEEEEEEEQEEEEEEEEEEEGNEVRRDDYERQLSGRPKGGRQGDGGTKGNPSTDVCYEVHPPAHSSSLR
ncbi:hypothetical protein HZU73_07990 [Apis mellifera caucasica]|nr:hypothetical protein HZU73_07990 [Apis mellifera caucasica]